MLPYRWGAGCWHLWIHTEEKPWKVDTLWIQCWREPESVRSEGKLSKEKEIKEREKKTTQQKVEQMSARRPCCVGFICVLVYLVGGVVAAAAVTAVGHRPLLRQRLLCFHWGFPDGAVVLRFCWSVKRRVSESVGCVRGCGFGSGPRTGKASMCQGYCEISR